jgi:hypothetical protein
LGSKVKIDMIEAETKNCQNCKQNFQIESEDLTFYEQMRVPPPTFCPLCRAQRRFASRNERKLYKSKSAFSGKDMFTMYPPESKFPVYTLDEWYSDEWDPMEYGMDYDFNRPFFEQFQELAIKTPRPARAVLRLVNSDYSNNASDLKNCYLLFNSNIDEDSAYGNAVDNSKNCIDNSHVNSGELCYENFWLTRCNNVLFSAQCEDCNDVWFSKNLRGCQNCFGCVNLRNKNYHIFNQQYSKEEYEKKIKEFSLGSYESIEEVKKTVRDFWLKFPNKYIEGVRNDDVSGAYISHSKNVKNSYLVREGKDMRYCQYMQVPKNEACYDHCIWGLNNTFTYECAVCGEGNNNIRFCLECYSDNKNLEYCEWSQSSSDLFGCFALRKKQYCILNKQYTKEEFEKLRKKIIQQMNDMPYVDKKKRIYKYGEFFPIELSVFAYNETIANEHFPLTGDQAIENGYRWRDQEPNQYEPTLKANDISDHINDVDDSILKEVIECGESGRAFRLIPMELQFYKRLGLPIPRLHPDVRHEKRIRQRNSLRLYSRRCQCTGRTNNQQPTTNNSQLTTDNPYQNTAEHFHGDQHCPNEFETSYAPDREEIVYCETCYNAEVV